MAQEKKSADNAKKKPSSNNGAAKKSSAKKKPASKTGSAKKASADRAYVSTANGAKQTSKAATNTKKQSAPSDAPRSTKTAHRILPPVFIILAIFIGACLFFNLFCNPENALASDPSDHWMGTVGYYICYMFFGLFGPAVFLLPILLVILALGWKKYVDNHLASAKLIASLALIILFSVCYHGVISRNHLLDMSVKRTEKLLLSYVIFAHSLGKNGGN